MAVITIGTTGATWGLTAETGVLVQTYSQKVSREKNEVRDNIGDVFSGNRWDNWNHNLITWNSANIC